MNIFFLDNDPKLAAIYACDKHCVKMILESAQMLSTSHSLYPKNIIPLESDFSIYKPSFKNHPCTLWVCKSKSNYQWLAEYAYELCKEYTYRYEKTHKSESLIKWFNENIPEIDDLGFTFPALAMPEEYHTDDHVKSYRLYYVLNKKVNIQCTWKKRNPPEWF